MIAGNEECDYDASADTIDIDNVLGCIDCQKQDDFDCTNPLNCQNKCGDGKVLGSEECDNDVGNPPSGDDGCSATC